MYNARDEMTMDVTVSKCILRFFHFFYEDRSVIDKNEWVSDIQRIYRRV
jgi:hypothetical protein